MIPAIALIIAAYVETRMLQIMVKDNPKEHGAVVFSAAITMILTLFAIVSIFMASGEVTRNLPPQFR